MRFYFFVAFTFLWSLTRAQSLHADSLFRIVGYYSLQSAMQGGINKVPFDELTHINLYFLNPDSLGNFLHDLSSFSTFIKAAHAKDVKVMASIGGGGPHPYYHKLLKDTARQILVSKLVGMAVNSGLDGIDVDIEGNDIDENYDNFVIELAAALHQHAKLITAAVAVFYKNDYTDKTLAQYDFVNLMSYDHTGPWAPEKPGPHSTYEHAVEDLEYFRTMRNIPKNKITLGVPFYGYGYGPTLTTPGISMNYGQIVTQFRDAELKDQLDMGDGKTLYYNGLLTIKKKTVLARQEASGIMIWQLSGDAEGEKSLLNVISEVSKE